MREVRLYGWLGERFGRSHFFDVRTPAEAVRALMANFAGFEREFIGDDPAHTRYKVWIGPRRCSARDDLLMGGSGPIRIAPVIAGAKSGGLFQAVLGVVIVGAAILTGQIQAVGVGISMTGLGTVAVSLGVSLVLGGIAQMLTPLPKLPASGARDEIQSDYFNGPVNTTAQGGAVPVLYGELFVGSAVISAGISVEQIQPDQGVIVPPRDPDNYIP